MIVINQFYNKFDNNKHCKKKKKRACEEKERLEQMSDKAQIIDKIGLYGYKFLKWPLGTPSSNSLEKACAKSLKNFCSSLA